jgi:hypothetical protein
MNQQQKLCEDEGCEEQPKPHTHMTEAEWNAMLDSAEEEYLATRGTARSLDC